MEGLIPGNVPPRSESRRVRQIGAAPPGYSCAASLKARMI